VGSSPISSTGVVDFTTSTSIVRPRRVTRCSYVDEREFGIQSTEVVVIRCDHCVTRSTGADGDVRIREIRCVGGGQELADK
jgi:hypothetical protein